MDPSIQVHDKADRLTSAHTTGLQKLQPRQYSRTRKPSIQGSQKFLAMNLSPYSKLPITKDGSRVQLDETSSSF